MSKNNSDSFLTELIKNINTINVLEQHQEILFIYEENVIRKSKKHPNLDEYCFQKYFQVMSHLLICYKNILQEDKFLFYFLNKENSKTQNLFKCSCEIFEESVRIHEHFHNFVNYILNENNTSQDETFNSQREQDIGKIEILFKKREREKESVKKIFVGFNNANEKLKVDDFFYSKQNSFKGNKQISYNFSCKPIKLLEDKINSDSIIRKKYVSHSPSRIEIDDDRSYRVKLKNKEIELFNQHESSDEIEISRVEEIVDSDDIEKSDVGKSDVIGKTLANKKSGHSFGGEIYVSRYTTLDILIGFIEKEIIKWDQTKHCFVVGKNFYNYEITYNKYIYLAENTKFQKNFFTKEMLISHIEILQKIF